MLVTRIVGAHPNTHPQIASKRVNRVAGPRTEAVQIIANQNMVLEWADVAGMIWSTS